MKSLDAVRSAGSISEKDLQVMVAQYLRLRHPNALFHSDYGSGVKLTPGQARVQSQQNGGRRAWPDLFIAEPRGAYAGLFIELKRAGTRLRKRDGNYSTVHIAEQAEALGQLRERGYAAEFACGFNEAQTKIDEYMRLSSG